jgi:tetratricopeptide (TPR) repeat protein
MAMLLRLFLLALAGTLWVTPAVAALIRPAELPPLGAVPASPAMVSFISGVEAIAGSDLTAAERHFRESMRLDATLVEPLIGMADLALARRQPSDAQRWLQRALQVAPTSAKVHHALGRFHFGARDFAQAEASLRQALSLDGNHFLAALDLGDLYLSSLNRTQDAEAAYRAAVRLGARHAGAHHGLGVTLTRLGKLAEAESILQRAASLAPNNPLVFLSLGRLYQAKRDWGKAQTAFESALRLQPGLLPAVLGKADALMASGDTTRALALYQQAVQAAPNSEQARLQLGMAFQATGRLREAERTYLEALRLNPNLALAYNNLAWMAAEARTNLAQAQRWAERAVSLAPAEPLFLDTLGWVFRAQGQLAEAERTLERAAAMPSAGAVVWYHLGRVYQERNKVREAERAYRQALELHRDFAPARQALGQMQKR